MKLLKSFLMCGIVLLGLQNIAMADQDKKDGEIIAMLNAINAQEIKEADLALSKSASSAVKDFASEMKDDHNQCLSETKDFSQSNNIMSVETSKVKDFKKDGDKEYTKLSKLKGHDFDTDYVDAMVKGHKDALSFLDDSIKDTKNAALKDYLTKVRATVQTHLNHAEALKDKIKK